MTDEPDWRKSSYSSNDGPSCVEIAVDPGAVLIRDSKNPQGPRLTCTSGQWAAFVSYAISEEAQAQA
ncbi:DUF397 domain-containing protein [Streptomyces sp. CA-132043]|uniref:DUF397 domain-containing protein n=1 Tax=Streptomyces sp. CA-132043 TaxID=3240048 RepID=UPI003D916629